MNMKRFLFAAAIALLATGHAWADGFSDTWMGLRDGPTISNPGEEKGGRNVNKMIVNIGHFDLWDYGSNFINVDVLFSNANEPANNSAGGSTELYGVYRGQFSPDKIFGLNTKIGPFSAINFEIGGDAETENTAFAPDKKLLVAGPNFHIDLPDFGFITIGVHVSKEWNNNGFSNCPNACFVHGGPVDFSPAPEFEFVWLYHLPIALPVDFSGFLNLVLPKGKDGFGAQTATEVLTRPTLSLDLGKLLFNKPHKPNIFIAVELWQNKFGNDHTKVPGSEEVSPEIGIEYHF